MLTVINKDVAANIKDIYNFYKDNEIFYQQYIECLDPIGEKKGSYEYSLFPNEYSKFLIELFDCWYEDIQNGRYTYVRYFDDIMTMILGSIPSTCTLLGFCASYLTIEADGSVYPCDFYVLDNWKVGNINTCDVFTMLTSKRQRDFISYSKNVPQKCKVCKWYGLCRNGCRRNCEPTTAGVRKQNYYCKSYINFFEHAFEKLQSIKANYNKISNRLFQ